MMEFSKALGPVASASWAARADGIGGVRRQRGKSVGGLEEEGVGAGVGLCEHREATF